MSLEGELEAQRQRAYAQRKPGGAEGASCGGHGRRERADR